MHAKSVTTVCQAPIIRKRGNGFQIDLVISGKRVRRSIKATSELEARELIDRGFLMPLTVQAKYRRADIYDLWRKCQTHAGQRVLRFDLTLNELLEMFEVSGFRCAVSGLPFDRVYKPSGATKRPFAASIDRIDNSLGYSKDNCRLVCAIANLAMGEWGYEPLRLLVRAIAFRRPQQ